MIASRLEIEIGQVKVGIYEFALLILIYCIDISRIKY